MMEKKERIIAEDNTKEKEITDILDALKDAMKVYDKTDYHLDANFLWCKKPEEKWEAFHTRQHIIAKKIERGYPNIKILIFDENNKPKRNRTKMLLGKRIPNRSRRNNTTLPRRLHRILHTNMQRRSKQKLGRTNKIKVKKW